MCYAHYYNKKYERTGHLFQDRYKSEVITDSCHLLSVYRYILKNSEKAGIAPADHYRWNSFADYGEPDRLTDTSLFVSLIGDQSTFHQFMKESDCREFLEDLPMKRDDAWALEILRQTLHISSGTILQKMSKDNRNAALSLLKSKGLSNRQLERLTGISRGVIFRIRANGDGSRWHTSEAAKVKENVRPPGI